MVSKIGISKAPQLSLEANSTASKDIVVFDYFHNCWPKLEQTAGRQCAAELLRLFWESIG